MKILWPWKMAARFDDDFEIEVCGNSDEECIEKSQIFRGSTANVCGIAEFATKTM